MNRKVLLAFFLLILIICNSACKLVYAEAPSSIHHKLPSGGPSNSDNFRIIKTENFIIDSPAFELSQEIGKQAEDYRRQIARKWIGRELPTWIIPCIIFVSLENNNYAWTYHYQGQLRGISIRGSREDIFKHSLPHEITHAVMLTYFGETLPRWCDEGLAVCGEKDCPHRLQGRWGKQPLRDLFEVQDYPREWEPFYGQGYSVTIYLIKKYDHQILFKFIRQGKSTLGWEEACRINLRCSIKELDVSWRKWHKENFENEAIQRSSLTWEPNHEE